jgi:sec-independent protein translocase protein TatA
MFTNIRGAQLLIILVVVLLFFGAKRLPELARSLGSSAKEFKAGLEDGAGDVKEALAETSDQANDVATDIKENLSDS